MGTRNLTVVNDSTGKTRVALYGQWDGYPSYSGTTALAFLRDKTNRDNLLAKLDNVEFITDDECDKIYNTFTDETDYQNKAFLNAYPGLHRDTGVDILEVVANSTSTIKTIDNTEFANDSLFCEGIYEVDFSTNKFTTNYNGIVIEYDLDTLPSDEDYLASFENDLTNA